MNPYNFDANIFKLEKSNVWFYGISVKRYCLYTIDKKTGEITIDKKKYSAHGLGNIRGIDEKQWWIDILNIHYHPEQKQDILSKYQTKKQFEITYTMR